jgi:hypothetical protein
MRADKTKPCNACPFRRASAPGWLGEAKPEEFIDTCLDDGLMPCHNTVDYANPNWRFAMLELDSKVQHCTGARIFYRNLCKVSRNPYLGLLREEGLLRDVAANRETVFVNREEFLKHHKGSWKK